MEGLIPLVYRAIVHYKSAGGHGHIRTWLAESPSASYIRLPGDSGRFQASDIQMFRPDYGFGSPASSALPSSSTLPPSSAQIMASAAGVKSPGYRLPSRRLVS